MDITALPGTTTQPASTGAASRLAGNFDDFLLLLTTQLQNQDPLSPMDTQQFTSELVQFASVEQQIQQSRNLEQLLDLERANGGAGAVAFLGKQIEAPGATNELADGRAEWRYTLSAAATSVKLTVTDAQGDTVFEGDGATDVGTHGFVWDGRDGSGRVLPEGKYTLSISAQGPDGRDIAAETTLLGRVTGLKTAADGVMLFVGDIEVPLADLLSVREAT